MKEKLFNSLKWFFNSFIWLGVLILVIDIVTKNVIIANKDFILSQKNGRIDLIPGFLGITYLINTNAAFGIGVGSEIANRILYIIFALIAAIFIVLVYVKKYTKLNRLYRACMMLILVGAVGNLVDRVFFTTGYLDSPNVGVVDWIDFYGIWKYVFNIADSAIVIGVIMLIIVLFVEEIKDRKKENALLKKDTPTKDVIESPATLEAPAPVTEETPKEDKQEEAQ